MDESQLIQKALEANVGIIFGEYAWFFVVVVLLLLFKSTIESFVAGLIVFIGSDYNDDDVVYLDGKPARIIRSGIWSTTFYIYEIKTEEVEGKKQKVVVGGNKLVINNTKLKDMLLEKPLSRIEL